MNGFLICNNSKLLAWILGSVHVFIRLAGGDYDMNIVMQKICLAVVTVYYFASGRDDCNQLVCISVCTLACLKNHMSRLYRIFCILTVAVSCPVTTAQYIIYFLFVDDVMFSRNKSHVGYDEPYGQKMSVSGRQCREGWSFSASSALSLSVLPPADWHPSAVNPAVHNRVWLWRWTMHYTLWPQCPILNCLGWRLHWFFGLWWRWPLGRREILSLLSYYHW